MTKEIYILGEINDELAMAVSREISEAINNGAEKIRFKINSGGGSVIAGLQMYDEISALTVDTEAIILGMCASSATYPALACGKVLMQRNASFMIHRASGSVRGTLAEMENDLDYLTEVEQRFIAIYAAKSGKSPEEIVGLMDATTYFNAEQALANGFIDEVVAKENSIFNVADLDLINSIEVEEPQKNIVQKVFDVFKSDEAKEEESLKNKLSAVEQELVNKTNELESLKISNAAAVTELHNIIEEYKLKEEQLKNEIAKAQASLNDTVRNQVNARLAALGYNEEDLLAPSNHVEKIDYKNCKSIDDFFKLL